MSALKSLFIREVHLALRTRAEVATQLVFALLVTSLFPLGLNPSPETLRHFAPGYLVLAVLFTEFLGFEKLFAQDAQSGTLDVIANSRLSFMGYALVKTATRWLVHALPLIAFSPVLGLMLNLAPENIPATLLALTLASLCITLAGSAAAALTLGAQRGFLLPLLLMPLCVPVLIFAAHLAAEGLDAASGRQAALFLGALALLYSCICPPLTAAALRAEVEAS
jgi:heme exporter protein B